MKNSVKKEYREKSVDELEMSIGEAHTKLFQLHTNKNLQKKAEKPHEFSKTRREIARMKTFIQEK
jgi:ribosomal protein L29